MAANPKPRAGKKKAKKSVANGIAHIQSTFNNTIVSITDLAGNVHSWVMDVGNVPYFFTTCADCAYLGTANANRMIRGGSWNDGPLDTTFRGPFPLSARDSRIGFRCARLP